MRCIPGRVCGSCATALNGSARSQIWQHVDCSHPLQDLRVHGGGLRVVASRVGQLAALIEDGYNSFCAPGDPPSLAAALLQLDRAPELRARLGRAARATVLRYHTWDAVVRRILSANLKPVTERRSVLVDA